ncbi:death-associated inhibitor of apoptosis 1-like [Myzus persicae]|uniref:death-associated inhibitor of apoptosis 1-like n=1 Tax=Myzus persicae TaxID=13164 RepID=UPI000B9362AA|nr:death-associated inhibitor of apoptosis 1-like [Myzus persicae]
MRVEAAVNSQSYLRTIHKSITNASPVYLVRNNSYPVYSDSTTFLSRLKSYNSFPSTSCQNKYTLSESGFRYTGVGDIVECFFCGLVLQKWTNDDIPWVEHAKWNPKCIFVLLCKGNEFIENVKNEYVKAGHVCDCNESKSYDTTC